MRFTVLALECLNGNSSDRLLEARYIDPTSKDVR